jgi:hypothetical protein
MKKLVALACLAAAGPAAAQPASPPLCTDGSRACLIRTATSYLDAIVSHDGSKARLAPDVRRTVNGREKRGEAALRDSIGQEPPMAGYDNLRWVVDEQTGRVAAFALLRVTAQRGTGQPQTVHLAERITVKDGLITEIEALYWNEDGLARGSGWPDE